MSGSAIRPELLTTGINGPTSPERPHRAKHLNLEYELGDRPTPQIVELDNPLRIPGRLRTYVIQCLTSLRAVAHPGVRLHWLVSGDYLHIMRCLPDERTSQSIACIHRSIVERGVTTALYATVESLISLDELFDYDEEIARLSAAWTLLGHINHPNLPVNPIKVEQYIKQATKHFDSLPEVEAKPIRIRYEGAIATRVR